MNETPNTDVFDDIQTQMARIISGVSDARDTYIEARDQYRSTNESLEDEKAELKRQHARELDDVRARQAGEFQSLVARAEEAVGPAHTQAQEALRRWRSEVVTSTQKDSVVSKAILDKMGLTVPRGEKP